MRKIRTLIVDDEQDGRDTLKRFLEKYCPDVEIGAEAGTVAEAVTAIRTLNPDLVFLDINLPDGDGFELFRHFPAADFYTIFVTAYDAYALKAIKHQAIDYILKPINIDELIETVRRVKSLFDENEQKEAIPVTIAPQMPSKIALPVLDGFIYVGLNDIIRCEAEGNYTYIHFTNRPKLLVSKNLGSYEDMLKDRGFVRVHHHHLINLEHVEKYQRGRGGSVTMSDQKEIEVSQRRRDDFLRIVEGDIDGGV